MDEPPASSIDRAKAADRVARHRQRYEMIVRLYDLALARNPEIARALGAEIANLLISDPALSATFDILFDRRPRATPTSLSASLTFTTVSNALMSVSNGDPSVSNARALPTPGGTVSTVSNASLTVSNASLTVSHGRLSGVEALAPLPPPPPSPTPSPPTRVGRGRQRDLHWEALERALGPCRGSKERDQRNGACAEMKAAGLTPEEIDTIAERWPSTMGFVMTANGMLKYAGQVLAGPQLRQHKQYLNETATLKHQSHFNSPEEYSRD